MKYIKFEDNGKTNHNLTLEWWEFAAGVTVVYGLALLKALPYLRRK